MSGRTMSIALVGVIMVCTSCLMFVYDPLQIILRRIISLTPGTFFFNLWAAPPYDVVMKIFIFNITNPEAFLRGEEIMNVTQIGPYSYKEILTNNNATFHDDGTVTYVPRRDFITDEDNSVGNAKIDRIIVPNLPLIGFQSLLIDSSFVTNIGFSTLGATTGAQSFLNLTVDEYLWGYEDKLVHLANQFIPSWIDFGKFGILERLMDRDNHNEVTISANPEKLHSLHDNLLTQEEQMSEFHIVKWNDSPGLKEWGYEEGQEYKNSAKKCQIVEGDFDGTIFPKPLRKHRNLTLFRKAFCRPVPLDYVSESFTDEGFRTYNYKLGHNLFASPEINPNNECYCYKGSCPGRGLQTIAPCYYGLPITLSQPHFLNGDPELLKTVNGLSPTEEAHASVAKIQPDLGIPLHGSTLKIQVNLAVGETKFNTKTKPFNGLTLPLMWIELTCVELPPFVDWIFKLVLLILPVAQDILSYLFALLGLAMISGAALLTLFFSKDVHRSLSKASDYAAIPLITIPAQYFKEKELRISK
ncbi:hypothetical protein JTB14_033618 [Gonioctena quinquepunctata]|nr:hypothetical protein JTB14_033618 [Gonioctena quinquepunctata]